MNWKGVYVAPWTPNWRTKSVVDCGPVGIAAPLFQLDLEQNVWRTIMCTSRAFTETEKRYSTILAILQGVTANMMYLFGRQFKAITDQQPLFNLYSHLKKQGLTKVEHDCLKSQCNFTAEYEREASNPTNYRSRHLQHIIPTQEDFVWEETFYADAVIDNNIPDN